MTVGPGRTALSDGSRKLSWYWTGDRPSGEIANLDVLLQNGGWHVHSDWPSLARRSWRTNSRIAALRVRTLWRPCPFLGEYVRQGCLTLFKLFERFLRDVNKLQAKRIEAQQVREEE